MEKVTVLGPNTLQCHHGEYRVTHTLQCSCFATYIQCLEDSVRDWITISNGYAAQLAQKQIEDQVHAETASSNADMVERYRAALRYMLSAEFHCPECKVGGGHADQCSIGITLKLAAPLHDDSEKCSDCRGD